MGLLARRQDDGDETVADGMSLQMDLGERVCAECGRDLHPWEAVCPDDGGAPVAPETRKASTAMPVPAHLLDEEPDGEGALPPEERGEALHDLLLLADGYPPPRSREPLDYPPHRRLHEQP
jgi:hypothetical protein